MLTVGCNLDVCQCCGRLSIGLQVDWVWGEMAYPGNASWPPSMLALSVVMRILYISVYI